MKLIAPTPEINEATGFDPKIDIFGRKIFGQRLADMIEATDGNLVIALDSPWGEGKSTFIKMWSGHVKYENKTPFKTIYFDAFENDYQKDPFLTLASELYSLIPDGEKKQGEFREKVSISLKSLGRGALKIGVRNLSGGLLDGSFVDSINEEVSGLLANQVDHLVKDRLENYDADKIALEAFKDYLGSIVTEVSSNTPLVFIIDELDRCRPDFALELLENIKHFFSVSGITFILVVNRKQLEASVRVRYGQDIVASDYLQKFVHLWSSLPRVVGGQEDDGAKYFRITIDSMRVNNEIIKNDNSLKMISIILQYKRLPYRAIERIASNFAATHNAIGKDEYFIYYQKLIGYLCYLKVVYPHLFEAASDYSIDSSDLLRDSGIHNIARVANQGADTYGARVINDLSDIVTYDLADKSTKENFASSDRQFWNYQDGTPINLIGKVSSWLSSFDISSN